MLPAVAHEVRWEKIVWIKNTVIVSIKNEPLDGWVFDSGISLSMR